MIWALFVFLSELYYCTGAYRISPTDVNSRPSSCLTNFLLNGTLSKTPRRLSYFILIIYYFLLNWSTNCYLIRRRPISAARAAEEVWVKGHQPHAQQPRGRDLPARAQQQPLHPGGPALHQRGLRGPSDRLPHHCMFSAIPLWVEVYMNHCLNPYFFVLFYGFCFRTLVNLWGRTDSHPSLNLLWIPLGNCRPREPKPSWSGTLDTGRWSSPRPPSSTCRQ